MKTLSESRFDSWQYSQSVKELGGGRGRYQDHRPNISQTYVEEQLGRNIKGGVGLYGFAICIQAERSPRGVKGCGAKQRAFRGL